MLIIDRSTELSQFHTTDFSERSLFFDIETTGFSPNSSIIYMIGCAWKTDGHLAVRQYFAEKKEEEKEILCAFLTHLADYDTLISFNGIGFDLPFLKGRAQKHGLACSADRMKAVDLFKEVSGLKNILRLNNYKQKTVEAFLGTDRADLYTGGELIDVYKQYTAKPNQEMLNFLLLHNYEDVLGMVSICSIRCYDRFLHGKFSIRDLKIHSYPAAAGETADSYELLISFTGCCRVPKPLHADYAGFYLSLDPDVSQLRIPLYQGELKFFYDNYKDYYYLPAEDRAIHKSLAGFVDREYREKCKAFNCYQTKEGFFLPELTDLFEPVFRLNYKDKMGYFEMKEEFFQEDANLQNYLSAIMNWIRCQ